MKDNLRFNRREHRGRHHYLKSFPAPKQIGSLTYDGYIKCKLVHQERFSLVIPDQIYISLADQTFWFQPFYFTANLINVAHSSESCSLGIDLSFGIRVKVTLTATGLQNRLPDGSFFYRCSISGPKALFRYATGNAIIHTGKPPALPGDSPRFDLCGGRKDV